jgi:hypothetical protein
MTADLARVVRRWGSDEQQLLAAGNVRLLLVGGRGHRAPSSAGLRSCMSMV